MVPKLARKSFGYEEIVFIKNKQNLFEFDVCSIINMLIVFWLQGLDGKSLCSMLRFQNLLKA